MSSIGERESKRTFNEALAKAVDMMIKNSKVTQAKLHVLGYDDPMTVEKKLKEIEREHVGVV